MPKEDFVVLLFLVILNPLIRDVSVNLMLGICVCSFALLSVYKVIKYRKLCNEEKKKYDLKSDIITYLIAISVCVVLIII